MASKNILIHALISEGVTESVIQAALVKAIVFEAEIKAQREIAQALDNARYETNIFEMSGVQTTKVVRVKAAMA